MRSPICRPPPSNIRRWSERLNMLRPFLRAEPDSRNDPTEDDISRLISCLDQLTLSNTDFDAFFEAVETLRSLTGEYVFPCANLFVERGVFPFLFSVAFLKGGVDDFIKSRILKGLANLLNEQLPVYATIFAECGIIGLLFDSFPIADTKVLLNVLKVMARLAISEAVAQDILDTFSMKPIARLFTEFYLNRSIYRQLQYLFYALSRCDISPCWDDFLSVLIFCLERLTHEKVYWVLLALRFMIFDQETAERIICCRPVMDFVVESLRGDEPTLYPPALVTVSQIALYTDQAIPDFDYQLLFELVAAPPTKQVGSSKLGDEVPIEAARAIGNLMANAETNTMLVEMNGIAVLVVAYRLASFEVNCVIIRAVAASVRVASPELLEAILQQGAAELLVAGLEIHDDALQIEAMTALLTLLTIAVVDDAGDHVVKAAWNTAVTPQIIEDLQTSENNHVVALLVQIAAIIDPPA
jgi:hypothetical protein